MLFFNESAEYLAETVEDIETPYEASSEGVTDMMSEASEEWYNLRERMMRLEHTAIVSEDMNLLSEGVGDFFTKIINFFKKMWAHLKAIIQKFWNKVMQFVATDKQFLKAYEEKYKEAQKKPISGNKFIEAVGGINNITGAASNMLKGVRESFPMGSTGGDIAKWKKEETFDGLRAQVAGGGSGVKSSEFKKQIFSKLGVSSQSVDFTPSEALVIDILKNAKSQIKALSEMKKRTDEQYGQIIKYFKAASSKVGGAKSGSDVEVQGYKRADDDIDHNDGGAVAGASAASSAGWKGDGSVSDGKKHTVKASSKAAGYYSEAAAAIKKATAIYNATVGNCITVISKARGEARKAVIAAVNGKVTSDVKERYNESAGFSILDQF